MKLCDNCKTPVEGEREYQDERANTQRTGQRVFCDGCEEDIAEDYNAIENDLPS